MKRTFIEFLTEKKKRMDKDVDERFKDVDCESEELSEEEMEYCAGKKLVKYLYKAHQAN
jgi:hypothetical protein